MTAPCLLCARVPAAVGSAWCRDCEEVECDPEGTPIASCDWCGEWAPRRGEPCGQCRRAGASARLEL
ncbi:MAG: hypothetical protein IT564_12710, partial [Rhodospirillales bacterium]|nr:hypothetical protein [Rhodospirillales bacterium]